MKSVKTLIEILKNASLKYPRNIVVRNKNIKDKDLTYSELLDEVLLLSNHLKKVCGERTKIALMLPNGYAWIKCFFSVIASGNVIIPIDNNWKYGELMEIVTEFNINVAIVDDSVDKNLVKKIEYRGINVLDLENLTFEKIKLLAKHKIDNNDCSAIYFTSGTTGKYKAVMISQSNLIKDCISIGNILNLKEESTILNVLPFYHAFAIMCDVIYPIYLGFTICISELKNFNQDLLFYLPNYIFAVPLIAENILKYLKIRYKKCRNVYDAKKQVVGEKLEYIICGGAVIRKNLTKELNYFGIKLIRGYGITECSPVVSIEVWNDNSDDLTVGIPIECNKVKIVDNEILVKGENVAIGYYGAKNQKLSINGWFKTGDLGYVGENNKLYINGRRKNLIILSNGENISVESLESVFISKGIEQRFIIFEEITYSGEHYLAMLFDAVDMCFEKFKKKIFSEINNEKFKIKKIYCMDKKFLKTSTHKINRKSSINRYVRLKLFNEISNILSDFIYQEIDILPEMELYSDLELDSLELLRLASTLEERFDVSMKIDDVFLFTSIDSILDYFINTYINIDDVVLQWRMRI